MKKEKEKKRKRDKAIVTTKDTDESLPAFSMECPPVPEKTVIPDSMMFVRYWTSSEEFGGFRFCGVCEMGKVSDTAVLKVLFLGLPI